MSSQYVFTMHRLSKRYPPDKVVFDDITLTPSIALGGGCNWHGFVTGGQVSDA